MNSPRDKFFASAGFAGDQNRRIAAGDLRHLRRDAGHRAPPADNLFEHRRLVDFFSKRHVFLMQPLFGPLPIVDIGTGDIPADDLALVVAHRVVPRKKPTIGSITLANSHLNYKSATSRGSTIPK